MNVWELEVFVAIVRERSFSRAAESLGRTQPAVSSAIHRLEVELGEVLFHRSSKDVALTGCGQVMYEYAQSILNTCREAISAVREVKDLLGGKLVIAANEYGVMYLLPGVINFRAQHPEVTLVVKRSLASRIPAEVIAREVELGVVSYQPREATLVSLPAATDETILIVPPKHRLARRESVSVKELAGESFIAQSVHAPIRDRVMATFCRFHVPMNVHLELPSLESVKMAVGLAFLPRFSAVPEILEGKLKSVRIKEIPYERRLYLLHRKGAALSDAASEFLKIMMDSTKPIKSARRGQKH